MGPIVAFDLVGPMAHFRKFYTNSSSLSYHIPPRTTLAGILAALLGIERNAYYEHFSLEHARIGVSLRVPVRTLVQTVNLLQTKTEDWHGSTVRTQIPTEWVLPQSPDYRTVLRYRIFFQHKDEEVTREVATRTQKQQYAYPLFLGVAYCPAWVENARLYAADDVEWADAPVFVHVDSVIPTTRVQETKLWPGLRVLPDRVPLDFNANRTLRAITNVLWEDQGQPLMLKALGPRFRLPEDKENIWHVFLEV